MPLEKRKGVRRPSVRAAKVQARSETPPCDCLITEMSDGGIRLRAASGRVTNRFTLILSNSRRECQVIWRTGNEVGAEFVD
jgi:hypothetical protein